MELNLTRTYMVRIYIRADAITQSNLIVSPKRKGLENMNTLILNFLSIRIIQ